MIKDDNPWLQVTLYAGDHKATCTTRRAVQFLPVLLYILAFIMLYSFAILGMLLMFAVY